MLDMDREAIAAEVVCKLFLDRRVGGRHLNEQAARTGLPPEARGPEFDEAMRFLAEQGWLVHHHKGRAGKDDQVSLEPSRLQDMLRFAQRHLPPDRLQRLFNHFPPQRRARIFGVEPGAGAPAAEAQAPRPRDDVLDRLGRYTPLTSFQEFRREFGQRLAAVEGQPHAPAVHPELRRALDDLRRDVGSLATRVAALERQRVPRQPAAPAQHPEIPGVVRALEHRLADAVDRVATLEAWMESEVSEKRRHFLEDAATVTGETGAPLERGVGKRCAFPRCRRAAEHASPRFAAARGAWRVEGVIGLCEEHHRGALLVVGREDVAAFRALAKRVPEAWTPLYVGGEEGPARRLVMTLRGRFPGIEDDRGVHWPRAADRRPTAAGAEAGAARAQDGPAAEERRTVQHTL